MNGKSHTSDEGQSVIDLYRAENLSSLDNSSVKNSTTANQLLKRHKRSKTSMHFKDAPKGSNLDLPFPSLDR